MALCFFFKKIEGTEIIDSTPRNVLYAYVSKITNPKRQPPGSSASSAYNLFLK
jgi:hypothetical protein